MGSIKINNTQDAYDNLIKTIKSEFEWYRQWTCAEEGESYAKLIRLGIQFWPGNNRKLWFIGDGKQSLDNRLDRINIKLISNKDEIYEIIDNIYAKASAKGGELYGSCKVKTNGNEGNPTILYSTGVRTSYKHIDDNNMRGFISLEGYNRFKNQFDIMFEKVLTPKAKIDISRIEKAWKNAFGDDSTTNVKKWNKVKNIINNTNSYVKTESKDIYSERLDRLKEFKRKWEEVDN